MGVDPAADLGLAQPVVTRVNGNGTNTLSYTLAQGETMRIEAIAVDADATAAAGGSVAAQFLAPSGEIVAESATAVQLAGGSVNEVTFAPFLPDSTAFGSIGSITQLQTGLVLTELPNGATVQIVATDTAVVLTEARIWATGAPGTGDDTLPPLEPRYLFPLAGDVEVELA